MPTVLIVPEMMREVRGPYVEILEEAGFEIRYPRNPHLARGVLSAEEAIDELSVADATLASTEFYTPEILASLARLSVIARAGVGYDRVHLPTATERGVVTTVTPNANHEAVAELALSLLFATSKSIRKNDRQVREGHWVRKPVLPLRGRTLGIFGLGRIGRSLAIRAKALGMKLIATEYFPHEEFVDRMGIELVPFDELLQRSDYISIHCPLTEETHDLFDAAAMSKMKPGSILINTARGGIVNETDLCDALSSGHLAAAGLDVFEQEPPDVSHPLFQLDQVVVMPHLAGIDESSIEAMGVEAAECIVTLLRGDWPEGSVVNAELKDTFNWK